MEVTIQIHALHATATGAPKPVPVNLTSSSATCADLINQICTEGALAQATIKNPADFQLLANGQEMQAGDPLQHGMVIDLVLKPKARDAAIKCCKWACRLGVVLLGHAYVSYLHRHSAHTIGDSGADICATASAACGTTLSAYKLASKATLATQPAHAPQLAPALQLARARARPTAAGDNKQVATSLAKAPALQPALALAPAPAPVVFEPRIIIRKREEKETMYEWFGGKKIEVGTRIRYIEERGPEGQQKGWETVKVSTHDARKTVTRREETRREKVSSEAIKKCRMVFFHPYFGPCYDRVTVGYEHTYKHQKRAVLTVDNVPYYGDWEERFETVTERSGCY